MRQQRDRHVAGDRVERLPRRLGRRRQSPLAPAAAAQPAARRAPTRARRARASSASSSVRVALEPHLPLRERPGREVDVRVGEARDDAAPAEVDDVGARRAPSRACRRRRRSGRPRSRARDATGSDGSSVRTTPFSRITVRDCRRARAREPARRRGGRRRRRPRPRWTRSAGRRRRSRATCAASSSTATRRATGTRSAFPASRGGTSSRVGCGVFTRHDNLGVRNGAVAWFAYPVPGGRRRCSGRASCRPE